MANAPEVVQVRFGLVILIVVVLCTGCTTSPNVPLSTSWSLLASATGKTAQIDGSGGDPTVFINAGDQYMVVFQVSSPSGIKNITLSGTGDVACNDKSDPNTIAIPPRVFNLPLQPNQQAFTQASNPYLFVWSKIPAFKTNPEIDGPALAEFNQCDAKNSSLVPLVGTTTYTGQATTYPGAASPSYTLHVAICYQKDPKGNLMVVDDFTSTCPPMIPQ
jgi:hypothetical protein